jgi:hypothetical protein
LNKNSVYDAVGHRARKSVAAAQTNYIYGLDGNVISEVLDDKFSSIVEFHLCCHPTTIAAPISRTGLPADCEEHAIKAVNIGTRRWRNYQIGVYLMWSTFNTDVAERFPFEGMSD